MTPRTHLSVHAWRSHAASAVLAYTRAAGGAVVWPEVEAVLAQTDWYSRNVGDAPPLPRIDPHHLSWARRALVEGGLLVPETATLNRRDVTAYLDGRAIAARNETRVTRTAASKRRLYRRFLSWTSDARLCGNVLERQVHATLDDLRGYDLLLERARPGQVSTIGGQAVPFGPLDHAGVLLLDPSDHAQGLVGFLVEDKNVRSILYPAAREVWDLLAKAAAFPDHVPVLVARQVHYTTRAFFLAIGAIAFVTTRQHFSPDIDHKAFDTVVRGLSLRDARRLLYPDRPSDALRRFFTDTLRGPNSADPTKPLAAAYRERWQVAGPICAGYAELRESLAHEDRTDLFQQFLEELDEAGLDVGTLRASHRLDEGGDEPDLGAYWDDT